MGSIDGQYLLPATSQSMKPLCLICDDRKATCIGFVMEGEFCHRAQVPPSNFVKICGDNECILQQKWNESKANGRKLWLCEKCALTECGKEGGNILGFLTQRQHAHYTRDAMLSMELRNEGF